MCFLISNSVLNDHLLWVCFSVLFIQYKIVFFKQSFINQCCTRVSFRKVIVHFRFLEEMQMSVKYLFSIMLILCAWYWSITLLMFSHKCFFSGIHERQFYTFWVVHNVCLVIVLALKDTSFLSVKAQIYYHVNEIHSKAVFSEST